MFLVVLIAFGCMLTNNQLLGRIWDKEDQNQGFWWKIG